jgi:hypothetical protein
VKLEITNNNINCLCLINTGSLIIVIQDNPDKYFGTYQKVKTATGGVVKKIKK